MTKDDTNQPAPESAREPLVTSAPLPAEPCTLVSVRPCFPTWFLAAILAVVTMALYWPATHHDFINYDDDRYVTSNPHVQNGLTLENLKWAFCNPVTGNWHPLTILSHMLDCQLFGLQPWGHHLSSVCLHVINTVLVFLLFHRLTGAVWRSWLVAALFGWHPLHVESVAWVSERKDMLSAGFGFLALLAYGRYANESQGRSPKAKIFYGLSLLTFALGLMSKPMLVTWPFVLLLLDYWPLGRFQLGRAWPLVREKIPFFTLAAAASVVTYVVQKQGGAVMAAQGLTLGVRSGNAVISYGRYLGKLFWPTDLAVIYPYPAYLVLGQVLPAGLLLAGLSVLLWMKRERYPFLLAGWLWFVGTLVPVIGLVQVGAAAMADRYTYIPSVGILVAIIWGMHELTRRWRFFRMALPVAEGVVLILCLVLTRRQLGHWQNSETLFRQALAVTKNNYMAHYNLGATLNNQGRTDEAIIQFHEVLRLWPDDAGAHYNLGNALAKQGHKDAAIAEFQEALRLNPDYADAHYNLGNALLNQGRMDEAISQFLAVLRLTPDDAEAHNNLGNLLARQGQADLAIHQFQEAVRLNPNDAGAHYNLGNALARQGRTEAAISQFQEAIRLNPDDVGAHNNLGNLFVSREQTDAAIGEFMASLRLKPDDANIHYNLGNILLKNGQIDETISQFQTAVRLKPDFLPARYNLGVVLIKAGRSDAAISQFQEVLRLNPEDARAHNSLGVALGGQGRVDEAIGQFREALRLKPDDVSAQNNLARALAQKDQLNAPASGPVKR